VVVGVIIGAAGGNIRPSQKISHVQATRKAPFQRKKGALLLKRPGVGATLRVVLSTPFVIHDSFFPKTLPKFS